MNCICKCWQDKTLKLNCARCGGIVDYIKCIQAKEEDSKIIILNKLKRDLEGKRADIIILKDEIKELENEIKDEENKKINIDSSSDDDLYIYCKKCGKESESFCLNGYCEVCRYEKNKKCDNSDCSECLKED